MKKKVIIISFVVAVLVFTGLIAIFKVHDEPGQMKEVLKTGLGVEVPIGFTITHTATESGRNRVMLMRMEGSSESGKQWITRLVEKDILLVPEVPITDLSLEKYSTWWDPEKHGEIMMFRKHARQSAREGVLTGYISNGPDGVIVFLEFRELES